MQEALELARRCLDCDVVPVGALVTRGGRIIGRGYNQREKLQDPTAHAEMIALTAAAAHVGHWLLEDCTMYVTLEPCPMCAGALVLARLPILVYARRSKGGVRFAVYYYGDAAESPRRNGFRNPGRTMRGVAA